jgi:rSAM/selenodomain-associated transferase 2
VLSPIENAAEVKSTRISVVIPTRDEAAAIRDLLLDLRKRAPGAELLVVDGDSDDATPTLAAELCDRVLQTAPNRARQMNAGVAAATGDVLWFLHADARIPDGALRQIERALQDPSVVGGFFRIRLSNTSLVYRLTDSLAHYAGIALRMRCGDHGFFARRETFEQIGGFPEVELMEDVDFFRKLRRAGRVVIVQNRIVVSARRYETVGPFRLTVAFGAIALLYFLHAPRGLLRSIYQRTCCREVACSAERSASY